MKTFNWEEAEKFNRKEVLSILKEFQGKPITEKEFVERLTRLARFSPSRAKGTYRNLKKKFGFFK